MLSTSRCSFKWMEKWGRYCKCWKEIRELRKTPSASIIQTTHRAQQKEYMSSVGKCICVYVWLPCPSSSPAGGFMLSVHNSTGLFLPTSRRRRLLYGDGLTERWTVESTCAVATCRLDASCSASSHDRTRFYYVIFAAPSHKCWSYFFAICIYL